MKNYMPTRVFTGPEILNEHKELFSKLGSRCLIITSAHSGKLSGALDDLEAIFKEEDSTITAENLENAGQVMREQGFSTALVVSDPLHMKRAMLYAHDLGMTAYSSPTPTSLYRSWKTKLPFLMREEFFYIGYRLARLLK